MAIVLAKILPICGHLLHQFHFELIHTAQLIHAALLPYYLKWTRSTKEANCFVRIMTYLPFLSLIINWHLLFFSGREIETLINYLICVQGKRR